LRAVFSFFGGCVSVFLLYYFNENERRKVMDYEIGKLNQVQAKKVYLLLEKIGIEKTVNEILTSRCLVATNENEEIVSFAEATGQDKADVYYFKDFSRGEKTKIKTSFFAVIFNKKTWENEMHTRTGSVRQEAPYMFPGG